MKTKILLFVVSMTLMACSKAPSVDSSLPANSTPFTEPTKVSTVGINLGIELDKVNQALKEHIGTTVNHRSGVSVKVNVHKVIINKAEEVAIKIWHESKAGASEARRRTGVAACNRHFRSSSRRECRHKRNNNHANRMREYNQKKARRIARNRRKEISSIEVKPSSGKDNYILASAKLDDINVSSRQDKLIVFTKVHGKIKLNIENPFDHAKEIKGLINKDFDIAATLAANVRFSADGKIELINKQVDFSPRFDMPSALKPLSKLADKMNDKIGQMIKKQVDKQVARIEFKQLVNEKLLAFTQQLNDKISQNNIWLIPNISKINFSTTNAFANQSNKIGVNLGLTFKPELIYSQTVPEALKNIRYDVELSNQQRHNHIAINSIAVINLADISPLLTSKVQDKLNSWLNINDARRLFKRSFAINKIELLSAGSDILVVLHTLKPVAGTLVLTTKPLIEDNGQALRFSQPKLYAGTQSALNEQTVWLMDLPFGSLLEDVLAIDLKPHFAKGLGKLKQKSIQISSSEELVLKNESFELVRLDASNGNLLVELSLAANIDVAQLQAI